MRPPFVFVDLETTGLSGGAGTHAFLVGCGWCEPDGSFVTRQFMLTRFADERLLLAAVSAEFARAGAIVSFNGKSFDAPVLETRYLFHRLQWPGGRLPHLDVLHPARRFWGPSTGSGRPERVEGRDDQESSSCSLAALERQVLGARRVGDVPGFEIPARYFQFVRSGDPRPLVAVFEHNRLDLLSLAGLTARLLQLVRCGPEAARNARETLALGRVYARAGLDGRARDAFERAVARASGGPIRVEALRALALAWRRIRQYDEAASCWRALLDLSCPPHIAREATEALAIHHEHRVRDLATAKAFALKSLMAGMQTSAALQHRLARLERKMAQRSTLKFQL
ncbi:MAG: ribonuclease H-like domain-containing protein [Acidobacteria bacterium]|nr:ribonuclease H-like domain-containing protein [Acidobacteriota bacterium]